MRQPAIKALGDLCGLTLDRALAEGADVQKLGDHLREQRQAGQLFQPDGLVSRAVQAGQLNPQFAAYCQQIWALGTALLIERLQVAETGSQEGPGIEAGRRVLIDRVGEVQRAIHPPPDARHDRPKFVDGKKYAIQHPGDYDFAVGRTAGTGEQVFFSYRAPYVVGVFFDREGTYLRYELRRWPQANHEFARGIRATWMKELGVTTGTILVSGFYIPELEVGIYPLPKHLEEFLEDPALRAELEAEREEPDEPSEADYYRQHIEEWNAEGNYVLYWGKEYWMTADGEVEST